MLKLGIFLIVVSFSWVDVESWGDNKKVKLHDIQTLTLYHGRMTTGRRTQPVPQIQCVGGSAGCSAFVPQVVQCYNRGSDGVDVQWECQTDMDNSYRFGKIDVICEGYDYPDDPYILKGSCGLEYTIDLTQEGLRKNSGHSYYSSGNYGSPGMKSKSRFGDLLIFAVVILLIYGLYKTCLTQRQYTTTQDDYNNPDNRFGPGYPSAPPPPPGFRNDYGTNPGGCGGTNTAYRGGNGGANNFWTGAMTGGILGYMFGNRNNRGYYNAYTEPRTHTDFGSSSFGSSGFASSSGTRTASGFGGTRRR